MVVTIYQGDALSVLKTLPTESVQCVVTSPPYFNLRAYDTAPQVWGGDPDHEHDFCERRYYNERTVSSLTSEAFSEAGPDNAERLKQARWKQDAACSCGAWRGELGLEPNPSLFVTHLVDVFREVKRVLRADGVAFINLSDSYSGSGRGPTGHNGIGNQGQRQGFIVSAPSAGAPAKNLLLIPQRFAIAMQDDGWIVRSCIAWCKTSAMPESVRDRPTSAWEPIWMFTKSAKYFYDADTVRQAAATADPSNVSYRANGKSTGRIKHLEGAPGQEPNHGFVSMALNGERRHDTGANLRNYWLLGPEPSREEHYASFPSEIPRRCIKAASRPGDTVLDPFLGSGTTALVADQLGRNAIGIELSEKYVEIARGRIDRDAPMVSEPVTVQQPVQAGLWEREERGA